MAIHWEDVRQFTMLVFRQETRRVCLALLRTSGHEHVAGLRQCSKNAHGFRNHEDQDGRLNA
jgi:hypothetical protein